MAEEFLSEVEKAIESGDLKRVKSLLNLVDPVTLVDILNSLDEETRSKIIPYIDLLKIGININMLNDDVIKDIEKYKGINEILELIYWLPEDDAVDFLQRLSPRTINQLFKLMSRRKARELAELLRYNPESVGGIMTTRIPVFSADDIIADIIKKYAHGVQVGAYDKHYYIYAVDNDGRLVGWLDAKTLLFIDRRKKLRDVVSKPPVVINPFADREEAAKLAIRYNVVELPVVDHNNVLLGIVTLDDLLDVVVSEYSEDLMKIGGFLEIIKASYIGTKIKSFVMRRVPPIILLYMINSLTGTVVAAFSNIIERISVLAAFLPMLADNSGNIGSQASALIIRGLALGEIKPRDVPRVLIKELLVSLAMSAILVPVAFAISFSITYFTTTSMNTAILVGLAVITALFVSVITADLIGALLPIFLARLRLDPATASAPLITTISDIITALTYFIVASMLIGVIIS